jgi:DNA-binding beta-propeller fold protein YncE
LPANWVEGEASGVALNSKGHIFLFQRTRPMLSEFDENGRYMRSLGEGLFDHPHGLRIDADDNIWTTDDTNNTVLKLSPTGKVLLVLGRRNNGGEANWLFSKPTDVAISKNGDILSRTATEFARRKIRSQRDFHQDLGHLRFRPWRIHASALRGNRQE